MALKWTKTSGPPSREMNPKPFASLNHLTVPVMRAIAAHPRQSARGKSGQVLCKTTSRSGGAGYVPGHTSAILATESDVGKRGRRILSRIALDRSGAGRTTKGSSVTVTADKGYGLGGIVRVRTWLAHSFPHLIRTGRVFRQILSGLTRTNLEMSKYERFRLVIPALSQSPARLAHTFLSGRFSRQPRSRRPTANRLWRGAWHRSYTCSATKRSRWSARWPWFIRPAR
jgi:hypothetical protein